MLGLRDSDQRIKRKEEILAKGEKWAAFISWIMEPVIADPTGNNEQYVSTLESRLRESHQTGCVLPRIIGKMIHEPHNDRDVQLALTRKWVSVHSFFIHRAR